MADFFTAIFDTPKTPGMPSAPGVFGFWFLARRLSVLPG